MLTASEARAYRQKMTAKQGAAAKAKTKRANGKAAAPAERAARPAGDNTKPTHEDIAYGPHERNKLDLWLAPSEKPTPLVIFIHGGGFLNGDKSQARGNEAVAECLKAGVSFASINYRFREHAGIQDILRDAARAVQYLRSRASELNLDSARVGAYGGSAGAGTSLWLAFHDDLADADAVDPVLRQSSRVAVAGSLNGQASYDLRDWEPILGKPPADVARDDNAQSSFYHFASESDRESPRGDAIMKDCSMISHVSADDPPVFLACYQPDGEPANRGHYVHHPRHSTAVAERCRANGVECEVVLADESRGDREATESRLIKFFLERLTGE